MYMTYDDYFGLEIEELRTLRRLVRDLKTDDSTAYDELRGVMDSAIDRKTSELGPFMPMTRQDITDRFAAINQVEYTAALDHIRDNHTELYTRYFE